MDMSRLGRRAQLATALRACPPLRLGGDGQSVLVNVPKDQAAGPVNNQQESFSFKVSLDRWPPLLLTPQS